MNISMLFRAIFFFFLLSLYIFFYPWLNSIFQSFRRVSFCFKWLSQLRLSLVVQIVVVAKSNITHRKQSPTLYSSQIHWVFCGGWELCIDPVDYYIDRKRKKFTHTKYQMILVEALRIMVVFLGSSTISQSFRMRIRMENLILFQVQWKPSEKTHSCERKYFEEMKLIEIIEYQSIEIEDGMRPSIGWDSLKK